MLGVTITAFGVRFNFHHTAVNGSGILQLFSDIGMTGRTAVIHGL